MIKYFIEEVPRLETTVCAVVGATVVFIFLFFDKPHQSPFLIHPIRTTLMPGNIPLIFQHLLLTFLHV